MATGILCVSATSSLPRQGCALARNRTDLDSPATCFRSRMRRRTGARACERSDTDGTHDAPACRGVVRSGTWFFWHVVVCRACARDRPGGAAAASPMQASASPGRSRGLAVHPSPCVIRPRALRRAAALPARQDRGHRDCCDPAVRHRGDRLPARREHAAARACRRQRPPWRRGESQIPNPESRPYNAQSTRMPATNAFGRSRVRAGSLNWSGCTM